MRRQIILSIFILVFSLTVYSSPKNKLKDLYEITEEKVYMVRISIPTMEDVEKLKDLGIECISPGKLSIKVTEDKFEELKDEGFEVDIVKKAIEVQGKRKPSHITKLREQHNVSNYSTDTPVDIEDYDGWATSIILISSAPYGALVTSTDVYYEIIHPYTGDLLVQLSDYDETEYYTLWDHDDGSNIYESENGINAFNGKPVNQNWILWARDDGPLDEGYINSWEITLYYGDPDLVIANIQVSDYEPWEYNDIDVYVTILNEGDGYASEFDTDIFYNEESQPDPYSVGDDYFTTDKLAPGQSITHTFESVRTDAPGKWTMYGLIDSWNDVVESNEDNNGYGSVEIFWKEQAFNDYYGWPIENFDVQHPLNATLNEYRCNTSDQSNKHFHDGIDIDAIRTTPVFNVAAGVADPHPEATYPYIRVGNFLYLHMQNIPSFEDDQWLNSETPIGETDSRNHLHFGDGDDGAEINPLRRQGINPYLDIEAPEILDVSLVRDGTLYETIAPNNFNGNVDIIAHAKDEISNHGTTGPKAVYRIGYQVVGVHSEPIYNIQFDNWLSSDNINYVYAIDGTNLTRMTSSGSEHYYIVTNNMTSNNYLDAASLPAGTHTLRITAQDIRGWDGSSYQYNTSDPFDVEITVYPTGVDEKKEIPKTFAIHQNFPNPFSERTEIKYQLPEECDVELAIYNVIGERVKTLIDGKQSPGYYSAYWSGKDSRGRNAPAGAYFLTCKAGKFEANKKIVKLQ
jgi:subtilisin-like proprotein convertase family protein/murein DD-endopeptidase MepM/ murein hydrolase activator NlpD